MRLPYVSADPWPRIALQVLGAELLVLAGLLTFWPRADDGERDVAHAAVARPTAATRSSRWPCC